MKNCDSKLVKLKIQIGNSPLFGPGKVLLLEAINDTGSISAGAKKIGMSYRKAWRLTNELNKLSKNKIINTNTGGKGVGGAYLTNFGKTFLQIYKSMEKKALLSLEEEKNKMEKLLLS